MLNLLLFTVHSIFCCDHNFGDYYWIQFYMMYLRNVNKVFNVNSWLPNDFTLLLHIKHVALHNHYHSWCGNIQLRAILDDLSCMFSRYNLLNYLVHQPPNLYILLPDDFLPTCKLLKCQVKSLLQCIQNTFMTDISKSQPRTCSLYQEGI